MIWPADKVERRQVAQLTPYARNARTHSPEQIAQIAASIREWGWTVPVLVDEAGGIIAGHGRVLAAQRLGFCTIKKIPSTRYPPSALSHPHLRKSHQRHAALDAITTLKSPRSRRPKPEI